MKKTFHLKSHLKELKGGGRFSHSQKTTQKSFSKTNYQPFHMKPETLLVIKITLLENKIFSFKCTKQ